MYTRSLMSNDITRAPSDEERLISLFNNVQMATPLSPHALTFWKQYKSAPLASSQHDPLCLALHRRSYDSAQLLFTFYSQNRINKFAYKLTGV